MGSVGIFGTTFACSRLQHDCNCKPITIARPSLAFSIGRKKSFNSCCLLYRYRYTSGVVATVRPATYSRIPAMDDREIMIEDIDLFIDEFEV